jgi:hypothetical protein
VVADVGEAPEGGGADVDGGVAGVGHGGGGPGGLEELLAGGDEVGGAGADAFGVADDGGAAGGEDVEEQFHVVDEGGGEGFHAVDGDALGDLAEELVELGVGAGEVGGAVADVVGEEEFAAGGCPQAVFGGVEGALVGDLEGADLLDLVAPELDAEGVFLGRGEDVEDAAADGELAAFLDELDAGVGGGGQGLGDVVEVGVLAGAQGDGFEVAEALDLGLEDGADGCDDDGDGAGFRVAGAGVGEAAEDGEAAADGVGAGGEPFVGQGLPGGELDDAVGGQERAEGGGQVLGLAAGGGDGQHGAAAGGAGEGGDGEGAGGGRADEVEVVAVSRGGGLGRLGEGGVFDDGVEQAVQAHGLCPSRWLVAVWLAWLGNAKDPARAAGRGLPGYAGPRGGGVVSGGIC